MASTADLLGGSERFTLTRIQLADWGTFSDIHTIPISGKGHLFVGGSGSGKSTILDAMSVVLSPKASNFNAAARQGERRSDRSFVSYIRGAWSSEQDRDGKAASKFLRLGPTWSAVALTYKSNLGREITLLFIGFIKGKTNEENQVRKHYFIVKEPFELIKLKDFGAKGFDIKLIKQRFPQSKSFNTFSSYSETFLHEFNIKNSKVLELLHKAQSAKNMGDINQFFREFMLAEPQTYQQADTLVENFSRLKEAYEAVKNARRQLEILSVAKKSYDESLEAESKIKHYDVLMSELPAWRLTKIKTILDETLPKIRYQLSTLEQQYSRSEDKVSSLKVLLDNLKKERYESGGDRLERLTDDKKHLTANLQATERKLSRLKPAFDALKVKKPKRAEEWGSLGHELRNDLDNGQKEISRKREEHEKIGYELHDDQKNLEKLIEEIKAMKSHPSNIPSRLLSLRDRLIEDLSLTAEDLPFVGELLEIKEDQAQWQGAAERVLHQFACSMLVHDRNYKELSSYVDKNYLGAKLVYHKVVPTVGRTPELSENSLPEKFNIKNGPWSKWVSSELAQRFDYECVQYISQFNLHDRAVTLSGQIKHNKSRHEKDDRNSVNDRRNWVTGFSNEAKRVDFERRAQILAESMQEKTLARKTLQNELETLENLQTARQKILEVEWEEIDVATPSLRLSKIEEALKEIQEGNETLKTLTARIEQTEADLVKAEASSREIFSRKARKQDELQETEAVYAQTDEELKELDIQDEFHSEINEFLASISKDSFTVKNSLNCESRVSGRLSNLKSSQFKTKTEAEAETRRLFDIFKREWPQESAELDTTLESAPEYFTKLEELEKDGLPRFEKRFRDILENNTKQNLINLFREVDEERRDIKARMREVNESLADAAFNRIEDGYTHLIIDIKDLRLDEFETFKKEQAAILSTNTAELSLTQAENYYQKLNDLVRHLDSREEQFKNWRDKVLDVRKHVAFQGRELNDQNEVLDIYDSGAGKSGGQRQKLTMTCLVAALRYQLGGKKGDLPSFAPIVMDEAFDKADSEFTDLSMKIFRDFGFQPIIATPEKGLFTLEPYMGSFAYVSCEERKRSSALPVTLNQMKELLTGESVENTSAS